MSGNLTKILAAYLLGLADDELILGHRDSEWCGHAPILEEDIALANLALDEMGHALQWYGLLSELTGQDPNTYPDYLVYQRPAAEFRNIQMVELPNGDWAFSLMRQYLFNSAEALRLEKLSASAEPGLAATAAKIRKEEAYHLRHSQAWMQRLGLGTEESHRRLQAALDVLWPYTSQLFPPTASRAMLQVQGYLPDAAELWVTWEGQVASFLRECGINVPAVVPAAPSREEHTPHLGVLLDELQSVARLDPQAAW